MAHSGKLWHCTVHSEVGFATKVFYQKHHKKGCQLFKSDLLYQGKLSWGKSGKEVTQAFPYGCPGSKATKKNGFSPGKGKK